MSKLAASNLLWCYIYDWDGKYTRLLHRCNSPTAVINYGCNRDGLWSRQEPLNKRFFIFTWMPFQKTSLTKTQQNQKKGLLLGITTYNNICNFIIQEKEKCSDYVDVCTWNAQFPSIIKPSKQPRKKVFCQNVMKQNHTKSSLLISLQEEYGAGSGGVG